MDSMDNRARTVLPGKRAIGDIPDFLVPTEKQANKDLKEKKDQLDQMAFLAQPVPMAKQDKKDSMVMVDQKDQRDTLDQ
jgi:hypothetical protein